jgi:hypothetical protein
MGGLSGWPRHHPAAGASPPDLRGASRERHCEEAQGRRDDPEARAQQPIKGARLLPWIAVLLDFLS